MKNATKKAQQQLILALKITGLKSHALSKRIGVADTTLSRLEKSDDPPEPRVSLVDDIDAAVRAHIASGEATEEQIILFQQDYAKLRKMDPIEIGHSEPKSDVAPAETGRTHMSDYQRDPRSIPVLGTAAGSALGSFEISYSQDPIDYARRPPSLAGLKEIYAIYVKGESMVPEHNPGDLRIIHPGRPPQPGDSVIIQTYNPATDTREAFIKRLISDRGNEVKCYQHNPKMEITYIVPDGDAKKNDGEKTYVIKVHKVLTQNELHGF